MLAVYIISFAILLSGSIIRGDSVDMLPQNFLWNDDYIKRMTQDINMLKGAKAIIKTLLFERQLMKMQCNKAYNKKEINSEVLVGIPKTLGEQLLMKFDNLENANKNQGNSKIGALNRNNELRALNRIDSKYKDSIQKSSNCAEALMGTQKSGIYTIQSRNYKLPFEVYCEAEIFAGDWTVIQRREDGSVNFYRSWTEYKHGFGAMNGEFFIGLDKLHALTSESPQELLIELEDFENGIRYAKYDAFAIGDESEAYKLKVLGSYYGNAGDSLSFHKNMKFTTKDRDNDLHAKNCAQIYKGAWWYKACHQSNLNGLYLHGQNERFGEGVEWYQWKKNKYSLKRVQMLIRPKIS